MPLDSLAPCGSRGRVGRVRFRMSYEATKPGFSFLCLFCVVVHIFWLVNVCFCCVRFSFPYQAKRLAGEHLWNDLFYVKWDVKLNSILILYSHPICLQLHTSLSHYLLYFCFSVLAVAAFCVHYVCFPLFLFGFGRRWGHNLCVSGASKPWFVRRHHSCAAVMTQKWLFVHFYVGRKLYFAYAYANLCMLKMGTLLGQVQHIIIAIMVCLWLYFCKDNVWWLCMDYLLLMQLFIDIDSLDTFIDCLVSLVVCRIL